MKKKLSMIVFAAVLIAFTCMYAIVDKNNAIYDRAVDTSQYVALGLEQGEMVSQSIHFKRRQAGWHEYKNVCIRAGQ